MSIHYGINGAGGRMGRRIIALADEDPELELTVALEAPGSPYLGEDLGVPVTSEIPLDVDLDVLIDFSSPEGTMAILPTCVAKRLPLVLATTGHTPEQFDEIASAAHETAILIAPNLSLVVNVLFELTRTTARLLGGKGFDVEIIERHHRFKKDSPSGTAAHFARIVQAEMGQTSIRHGREGIIGERPGTEIGMHAVRGGDNVGEHTVIFTTLGETLELVHKGHSRDSYARGALVAAKYLAGKGAGSYSMKDVLGL